MTDCAVVVKVRFELLTNLFNKLFFSYLLAVLTGSLTPSIRQTYSAPVLEEAMLYIYTGKQNDVPRVLQSFDDLVKERFVRKDITDDTLPTLDPAEV